MLKIFIEGTLCLLFKLSEEIFIYYAALDPVVGRETGKTRPVLIIQNDIGNMYSPTTIVAVITEYSKKKASYPICVAIRKEHGLKKFNC